MSYSPEMGEILRKNIQKNSQALKMATQDTTNLKEISDCLAAVDYQIASDFLNELVQRGFIQWLGNNG